MKVGFMFTYYSLLFFSRNCAIRVRNFEINVITKKFKVAALFMKDTIKRRHVKNYDQICLRDWLTATES